MLLKKYSRKISYLIAFSSMTLLVACNSSSTPTDATYKVTFNSTFSETTHPTMAPPGVFSPTNPQGLHFSPIVGAAHNSQIILWENGQTASAGIEQVAETGKPTGVMDEATAAMGSGVNTVIVAGGGSPTPGMQEVSFTTNSDFPQVSLVTMIAPSPDWFAGVSGVNLISNGAFIDTLIVDMLAYDAGTDNGTSYLSANSDTQPRGTIQGLLTDPVDSSFTSEAARKIGTLTFVKQ